MNFIMYMLYSINQETLILENKAHPQASHTVQYKLLNSTTWNSVVCLKTKMRISRIKTPLSCRYPRLFVQKTKQKTCSLVYYLKEI